MDAAPKSRDDFEIAIVCALPKEFEAVQLTLDISWEKDGDRYGRAEGDPNAYRTGRIGDFNVVLVLLRNMGTIRAAGTTASLRSSFPNVKIAFVCGICGGAPKHPTDGDILLGDVVISDTVVQYDLGAAHVNDFKIKDTLAIGRSTLAVGNFIVHLRTDEMAGRVETQASTILDQMQQSARNGRSPDKFNYPGAATDRLFHSDHHHKHRLQICDICDDEKGFCRTAAEETCVVLGCRGQISRTRLSDKLKLEGEKRMLEAQKPRVFVGSIGSGNSIIKSGSRRDELIGRHDLVAFEMEGAGVWDELPCIIVKGVCDYADSHKNDVWQHFAAAVAAAVTKTLVLWYPKTDQKPKKESSRQISLVPYRENTKFSGRDTLLENIRNFFTHPERAQLQRRLVLQGYPGIGKTTLALQYSAIHSSAYDGVFWVDARNSSTQQQPMSEDESIQDTINREIERIDKKVQKLAGKPLAEWCMENKWLWVIDNLDDSTGFQAQLAFPQGSGDILITSRRTDLGRLGTVIEIPPLSEQESVTMLCSYGENRVLESGDDENARAIARLLHFVPLALEICGSLVSEQRQAFSSYIKEFDDLMIDLVDLEDSQMMGDNTFHLNEPKSLLKTFELSLLHLRKYPGHVSRLLLVMANLDYSDMTEPFLLRCLEKHTRWAEDGNIKTCFVDGMPQWLQDLSHIPRGRGLKEALKILTRFSLLSPKKEQGHFHLHPASMTHFWLRWKQETAPASASFADALALLGNGYPNPDFSRTYGLSMRHRDLRNVFRPHLLALLKTYKQLQYTVCQDRFLLAKLANVFIQASDTPEELRVNPMRVRMSTSSSNGEHSREQLINPFSQDIIFLSVIEDIMSQLQCPETMFLHATCVFFDYIHDQWKEANPHPNQVYTANDIWFAGISLASIHEKIRLGGDVIMYTISAPGSGISVQQRMVPWIENIRALRPIFADRDGQTVVDPERDKQCGILGLIALKYLLLLNDWLIRPMSQLVSPQEVSQAVNAASSMMSLGSSWLHKFEPLLHSSISQRCDLLQFAHAQLVVAANEITNHHAGKADFTSENAFSLGPRTKDVDSILKPTRRWAQNAVVRLSRTMGSSSVFAATGLFMLIWNGTYSDPPQLLIPDDDLHRALVEPINTENFYFIIKLIDAWQYNLKQRKLLADAEELILSWLGKFRSCELRYYWDYANDPILDLYEFIIYFYTEWSPCPAKAEGYKAQYEEYFDGAYGDLFGRLCLGCGVGVFGMRHARSRVLTFSPTPPNFERGPASLAFFRRLKQKLGPSGSCLPSPDASRRLEQKWCVMRYWAFMRPSVSFRNLETPTTISGSAPWRVVDFQQEAVDEALFEAESDRVKSLVLEAWCEAIIEDGIKDGDEDSKLTSLDLSALILRHDNTGSK